MNKLADQIKALGFRVFIRDGGDTYAHFTDGKSFGYVQTGDYGHGYSISSVHKPNQRTGTGFGISKPEALTKENLSEAFCIAPYWASQSDRASVNKYESEQAFLKAHSWGGGLQEV